MDLIFANGRQALKVRIILWASLLACAGALYGAYVLADTYGLNPGDGGVLKPLGERLTVGALVASLGLAFAGGMTLFASRYVLKVARLGDRIDIETMAIWGSRVQSYDIDAFRGGAYAHGRQLSLKGQTIDAPWISLRVAGRRLPFVLDLQAEEIDIASLSALAEGAVTEWREDGG